MMKTSCFTTIILLIGICSCESFPSNNSSSAPSRAQTAILSSVPTLHPSVPPSSNPTTTTFYQPSTTLCHFRPIDQNDCPRGSRKLMELGNCHYNMVPGEHCECDGTLPNGVNCDSTNNCGGYDVFEYYCPTPPADFVTDTFQFVATGKACFYDNSAIARYHVDVDQCAQLCATNRDCSYFEILGDCTWMTSCDKCLLHSNCDAKIQSQSSIAFFGAVTIYKKNVGEVVQVVVEVTGVNDANKGMVCDAFAAAVIGTTAYCSLSGPNTGRRLLTSRLYMDITVADANRTMVAMDGEHFISNKVMLPTGVQASSLTVNVRRTTSTSDCLDSNKEYSFSYGGYIWEVSNTGITSRNSHGTWLIGHGSFASKSYQNGDFCSAIDGHRSAAITISDSNNCVNTAEESSTCYYTLNICSKTATCKGAATTTATPRLTGDCMVSRCQSCSTGTEVLIGDLSLEECKQKCLDHPDCKGIDFGKRDRAGKCYLNMNQIQNHVETRNFDAWSLKKDCTDADLIRLTDGVQGADNFFRVVPTNNGHGFLQMKTGLDKEWYTVNAEGFGKEELGVVCYQLGFPRNSAHTMKTESLAPGLFKQDKFISNVRCDVSAQRLQDCTYDSDDESGWSDAIEVTCAESTTSSSTPLDLLTIIVISILVVLIISMSLICFYNYAQHEGKVMDLEFHKKAISDIGSSDLKDIESPYVEKTL